MNSSSDWKQQLRESFSSVDDLIRAGLISQARADALRDLGDHYQVRVTSYYASLMEDRPDCPIRRQALPDLEFEGDPILPAWAADWSQRIYGRVTPWIGDSIGDVRNLAASRLTHRYENRAILHLSSMCAVYCRFCFRKQHLNEAEKSLYGGPLDSALEYVARTPTIRELILTGGDPLSVSDDLLEGLLDRISAITHVKVVRVHSRMPVTLPGRLTPRLAEILGQDRGFFVNLVSHFNHPRELTPVAMDGLRRLALRGVGLYNQSVLMRGVNDSVKVLAELFQGLYERGIRPFYLHHPDWTPGTFGFRVSVARGQELVRELRGRVPGPALPEYVLDIPGGEGKIALLESDVTCLEKRDQQPGDRIAGAIYELTPPRIRHQCRGLRPESGRLLYLDLHPVS